MHLHCQYIALLTDIRRQVELRGSKAVLRITDKFSVQPKIQRLLRTLKADPHGLAPQRRIQVKNSHVGAHRVIGGLTETAVPRPGRSSVFLLRPGSFYGAGRAPERMTLPGVHHIDIVDLVITGHLDMHGHRNPVPAAPVIILPVKVCRSAACIHRKTELPLSVQALPQREISRIQTCLIHIVRMIAVGRDLIHPKYPGIIQPSDIRLHSFPPYFQFRNVPSGPKTALRRSPNMQACSSR